MEKYKYLEKINSLADFKAIDEKNLDELSEEIRDFLVEQVTKNGGHLASNLGVVELTMAIHRVFDSPHDHVIFDVGHQSYVHKILTGRRDRMDTLRKAGGISGFTKRDESEHDAFGAGHSSTSLSAALGFAVSDKLSDSDAYTVAVVGDGAFTGGMIHEALNNCRKDLNLVIIINENEMSISKNIGRFATSLSKLRAKSGYFKTKRMTVAILKKIPLIGTPIYKAIRSTKQFFKNALYGSNYFEEMGLTYLGPVDGNDYTATAGLLKEAKKLGESVIVHVKTKKGKGFELAENDPGFYHGLAPQDKIKGGKNFSELLGECLADLAMNDKRLVAITAAMGSGTGLTPFADLYPDRFFDVGIAEEHAVTFAAGLAANGMLPFVCLYSTFLQRGYDNVIHDVALQGLPVIFCIDRAGLNAADGATHHGIFDVSLLSQIPGMTIIAPATKSSLYIAIDEAIKNHSPCAIRYPNACEDERIYDKFYKGKTAISLSAKADFSKSDDNPSIVFIAHGRMMSIVLDAKDQLAHDHGIEVGCILIERLKPYNDTAKEIEKLVPDDTERIIFVEEEIRSGGMGICLNDKLTARGTLNGKKVTMIAPNDDFVISKEGETVFETAGVSAKHLVDAVINEKKL